MSFTKGLKKKTKALAQSADCENGPLYPGPNLSQNVSGSEKFAFAKLPKPPMESAKGLSTGIKAESVASRVTPQMSAYGAPKGISGLTGKSNTRPFQMSLGKFGRRPRSALKAISNVSRGI